jgi:hypothetical protein
MDNRNWLVYSSLQKNKTETKRCLAERENTKTSICRGLNMAIITVVSIATQHVVRFISLYIPVHSFLYLFGAERLAKIVVDRAGLSTVYLRSAIHVIR